MSTLTFLFKDIFPDKESFETFLTEFDVVGDLNADKKAFADYLFKIMNRKFHNSNIQFDTQDDFKCELANKVEDTFDKYARQLTLIEKMNNLTDGEIQQVSTALANSANNPNDQPDDPTKPLPFISAQAYSMVGTGKLQALLTALKSTQTKLIDEFLDNVRPLFKGVLPQNIVFFED